MITLYSHNLFGVLNIGQAPGGVAPSTGRPAPTADALGGWLRTVAGWGSDIQNSQFKLRRFGIPNFTDRKCPKWNTFPAKHFFGALIGEYKRKVKINRWADGRGMGAYSFQSEGLRGRISSKDAPGAVCFSCYPRNGESGSEVYRTRRGLGISSPDR